MNWDFLVSGLVLIFLGLTVWSRVSKQTMKETILDITDLIRGRSEDAEDAVEGVVVYE